MKKLTTIMMMLAMILLLVSCDNIFKEKYKVQFRDGNDTILELEVVSGEIIEEPSSLYKDGYILNGWYQDLDSNSSKWDFKHNKVVSHLLLHAKWIKDDQYTVIENVSLEDGVLSFDSIKDSSYTFTINGKVVSTTVPNLDLNSYLDDLINVNNITIKAVLTGKTPIVKELKVQYKQSSDIELLTMDFEDFTKGTYGESIIEYNSYRFRSLNSMIQANVNDNKFGTRSMRFTENGVFEFLLPVEEFYQMTFYLGDNLSNDNINKLSKLNLSYRYNLNSEWVTFNDYISTPVFTKYEVKADNLIDFDISKTIYFKFEKDGLKNARVNIDDIYITTRTDSHFKLVEGGSIDLDPYYKSIEGLSGKHLIDELNFILSTNTKDVKYSEIKEILEFSDADLTDSTKVVGIYNQVLYRASWGSKSEWHREHVWPNSRLAMDRVKESGVNQGSDPHNLRAINPSVNSSRSNRYYSVALDNTSLGHATTTGAYYPGDLDKGDVSRILLYMVIRYDKEGLILTSNEKLLKGAKAYTKEGAIMGKLDLLYDWHLDDPVDEFEVNRNNVIYDYQGNRNPFIDHPELFEEVFKYYLKLDEERLINLTIIIDYSLDYNDFKKNSAKIA